MQTPRRFHTATLLPDGTILVVGGTDASGAATNSAELYDPATQTCHTPDGDTSLRYWALVTDDGRLTGVITRKTLVREVVARGLDPKTTRLGAFAEPPNATIESTRVLAQAFAFLEENDYERVPVVEDGRLVGVLSRSAVQRRLAEDEPPDPDAG